MLRLGILVSGRGSNMDAIIEQCRLKNLDAKVVVVISNKKDSPALEKASKAGIESVHLKTEEDMVACLQEHKVDLICLAGFMRMIKEPMLVAFPQKIINIHPSLLPNFPGLDTHQRVLDAGHKESGCTVHYVDAGMDTGEIILQASVPVLQEDTEPDLSARVLKEEHRIYAEAIQKIALEQKNNS